MPSFTLTDASADLWVETFSLGPDDLNIAGGPAWSVTKTRLKGGRRDGVDLIQVENGRLAFSVIPTRGMNLWKGRLGGLDLGWKSPVTDGPVNPCFVDLQSWGGLGWLDGFDELLARCGTESYGPPFKEGDRSYTLHGRISNIPARFVAVHVEDAPPHAITIEGQVDECRLFSTQTRLVTRMTTVPGSNRVTIRDEFHNLRDSPGELQILYHWNLGPPLMEDGARFLAPMEMILPRDAEATRGLGHFGEYGPPLSGSAEQVYFFRLLGEGPEGRTLAMLRNRAGDRAAALRFSTSQLPTFTLWKCQRGPNEGYVTGLEPATGYPNARPFEAARNRVLTMEPGGVYVAETTLEVLDDAEGVARVEAEIAAIQGGKAPTIHPKPVEPFVGEA